MPKLSRSELANLVVGLPIVTSIIGVLVGAGLGFGAGWAVKPTPAPEGPTDEQVAKLTLDAFSAEQIEFKCGQIKGEELESANERIAALERERDDYERKVLELESKLDQRSVKQARLAEATEGSERPPKLSQQKADELEGEIARLTSQLDQARNQLASVTRQLDHAEEEKRQLQEALVATSTRLRETEEQLEVQIGEAEEAKIDATEQKWWRFLSDSQLEICEKGSRKKMGRCREAVQSYLKTNQVRNKFVHCVRSKQAVPAVDYLDRDETMPRFAEFMNQDDRIVRDWYVQLCDPTLPEAIGMGEGVTPAALSER